MQSLRESCVSAALRSVAPDRNDFHVYRCELLRAEPLKGHDHEISWVGWLDADEVAEKVSQGAWRFPEALREAAAGSTASPSRGFCPALEVTCAALGRGPAM